MKKIISIKMKLFAFIGMIALFTACTNDMNVYPKDDNDFTSEKFYADPLSYKEFLAKIYGGFAVTGQAGPAGAPDIQGIDEGFGQYLRGYWQLQELCTDEAMVAWGDPTLPDLNTQSWNADNQFTRAFYSRAFYQIGLANEYLRETTDAKLDSRAVSADLKAEVKVFRAEVRFLRAMSYYHAIDLFGKVAFATEEDKVGVKPQEKDRIFVFNFIVEELKAIIPVMKAANTNEYGRADQRAAKMLLAKLYLNSIVYTGINRDTDALASINEVIASSVPIDTTIPYSNLFMADNDRASLHNEIIFAVRSDGTRTTSWGATTYLVHAPTGNWFAETGVDGGWFGLVGRPEFAAKFSDLTGGADKRAIFFQDTPISIPTASDFFAKGGLKVKKWKNITSTGVRGSNASMPDTDFPMFRLADTYLMYAELAAKGLGSRATAVGYVNILRTRAQAAQITDADLTLQFVLDERSRELYWEGHRRQDLIRFGKYSGSSYLWQWKGGVQAGISIDDKYKLYPIPQAELNTNSNLTQNPGY
jgi:hypothetical protein